MITTTPYLSTHLIVPYFITPNGTIKRPEHLIAWWSRIFSFYIPDEKDRIELRSLCRLFRDALKPPPLYTTFPHPNYPTLNVLMDTLNDVYNEDRHKAPIIVFVMEGTFYIPVTKDKWSSHNSVTIGYPIMIIGAGQDKTIIHGGFLIQGLKEKEKEMTMQDMTIKGSSQAGLGNNNGLSFSCTRMTFTECCHYGLWVYNTKGRLINCVVTQCRGSGIYCSANALIELEGNLTKVERNCTGGVDGYGLITSSLSSIIHLLFPLTKESVSTNNRNGKNYGSRFRGRDTTHIYGTIETVNSFRTTTKQHNIISQKKKNY